MNAAVDRKPVDPPCSLSAALPVNKRVRQAGFPENMMQASIIWEPGPSTAALEVLFLFGVFRECEKS